MKRLIPWMLTAKLYALSTQQQYIKQLVYIKAKVVTNYPTLMVNICETESSFGRHLLGDDKKSLGIFQFQVSTVRDMVRMYPVKLDWINGKTDKELETLLLLSPTLSTNLAAMRFEYLRKRYGWQIALSLHNGGKHNNTYIRKVLSKRK